jgi:hypothetical protein
MRADQQGGGASASRCSALRGRDVLMPGAAPRSSPMPSAHTMCRVALLAILYSLNITICPDTFGIVITATCIFLAQLLNWSSMVRVRR